MYLYRPEGHPIGKIKKGIFCPVFFVGRVQAQYIYVKPVWTNTYILPIFDKTYLLLTNFLIIFSTVMKVHLLLILIEF